MLLLVWHCLQTRWSVAWRRWRDTNKKKKKLSSPNMNLIQGSTTTTGDQQGTANVEKAVEKQQQPSCSRQSSQDDADSSSAVGVKQSPSGLSYSARFFIYIFSRIFSPVVWSWVDPCKLVTGLLIWKCGWRLPHCVVWLLDWEPTRNELKGQTGEKDDRARSTFPGILIGEAAVINLTPTVAQTPLPVHDYHTSNVCVSASISVPFSLDCLTPGPLYEKEMENIKREREREKCSPWRKVSFPLSLSLDLFRARAT